MPAAVPYFIQVTQAHDNHTRKREVLLICGNSTLQLHGQWAWFKSLYTMFWAAITNTTDGGNGRLVSVPCLPGSLSCDFNYEGACWILTFILFYFFFITEKSAS